MIPLITDNHAAITALCQRYGVVRLELFGSGAKGTFDEITSDLDFLVDLGPYGLDIAKRYLRLADALEALAGQSIC